MLHCPLCNGPVEQEEEEFVCAIGHSVDAGTLLSHTDARLAEALWMAIEALDNEAFMLRMTAQSDQAGDLADTAERQAQLLRQFGKDHAKHID